jgi:3-oxoacyl-[acyl-carrier protein] reductase
MDFGIKGKLGLVTGASRGIGEGICRSLAREGVRIIATSRTEADLCKLIEELGGESSGHYYFPLNIADADGPARLIGFIKQSGRFPDIVVNNVGGNLNYTNPLGPVAEWRDVMRINVEVALEINRALIPHMQQKKWGRICHVSSISALENQGPPAYSAAKAALNAYVRGLARYVAPDNVVVTSVMPGAIFTAGGYWDIALQKRPEHVAKYLNERMAIHRFGRVEEISEFVTFLCSEQASFCIGSCFLVDGGQGRVFYPTEF